MSQQEVIDYLRKETNPKTAKEIKTALDKAEATTQKLLRHLIKEGVVYRRRKDHHRKTFIYSLNHNA
jgi:predicted transcriptional regulator